MSTDAKDVTVEVHADHGIDAVDREYAQRKIAHVAQRVRGPVLLAKIDLHEEPNPSQSRPAEAKAVIDVNGTPIRAHSAAASLRAAIDQVEDRLLHRLEHELHRP